MKEGQLTNKNIFKFVLPSILLMLLLSVYMIIDGIFVSRFVGELALGAQNIVSPLYTVALAVGIMFATGGSALIAIKIGKGKVEEASRNFTSLLIVGSIFGVLATIGCLFFKEPLVRLLGGEGMLLHHGLIYSTYLIISFPFLINKSIFDGMLKVDGVPNKALIITVAGGLVKIILNYLLMVVLDIGIAGAGLSTLISLVLANVICYGHFLSKKSKLKLKLSRIEPKFILSTVTNGSSEMVNEIAVAMTIIIYNMLTLRHIGEYGVSAITIINGINFMCSAVFMGLSMGVAPLISYNYGANNTDNIQKILRFSRTFILIGAVVTFAVGFFAAEPLVSIYTDRSSALFNVAAGGMRLFSIAFIFMGINIFASALFTAFGNGKISALISFVKSFGFFILGAIVLPFILKADGIFLIQPFAELLSIGTVTFFLIRYQERYGYKLSKLKLIRQRES